MSYPQKLYIEPSSACNLKCKMCFRNSWIDEESAMMSDSVWLSVKNSLNELRRINTVMFAGMGEPLTHPRIFEMLADVSRISIRTELLTNASLLVPKTADRLTASGLNGLWVSVDGFSRESYEKIQIGSRYDLIYNNLRYFSKHRKKCSLGITFVIMKENKGELCRINDFADKIGADEINLSYAIPSVPVKEKDTLYDSGIPVGKMKRLYNNGVKRKLNFCPFIKGDMCFIKHNGDITPCMQLLHSSYTYLFEERRKVIYKSFGNISDNDLKHIWNSAEYNAFRERVGNFEFPDCTLCDGCDDRLSNEKDCMYNIFPTCGACLWAQGAARCP